MSPRHHLRRTHRSSCSPPWRFEVAATDTPWWLVVVFLLGPDMALFLGIGSGLEKGQLPPARGSALQRPAPLLGPGGAGASRRSCCRRAGSPPRSPGRCTSRSTARSDTACGRPRAFSAPERGLRRRGLQSWEPGTISRWSSAGDVPARGALVCGRGRVRRPAGSVPAARAGCRRGRHGRCQRQEDLAPAKGARPRGRRRHVRRHGRDRRESWPHSSTPGTSSQSRTCGCSGRCGVSASPSPRPGRPTSSWSASATRSS